MLGLIHAQPFMRFNEASYWVFSCQLFGFVVNVGSRATLLY